MYPVVISKISSMKNLWLYILLFGILAASISCEQEGLEDLNIDEETITDVINEEGLSDDCLELVFPLEVKLPNGNIEEIADGASLEELFSGFDDEGEFPEFIFPLDVINADGEQISVNEEEFYILLEDCEGDNDEGNCIELVFPVTIELADGTIQEVEDAEALEAIYADLDDDDEEPQFQFPITVVFDDIEMTVSAEELEELEESCYESDEEDDFCFELVYPVSLILPDGNSLEVDNEEALEAIFEEYEDMDEYPAFEFPLTIEVEDGEELMVSEEEFEAYVEACEGEKDWFEILGEEVCFDFVYPVFLTMPNGDVLSIEDADAVEEILEEWYSQHPDAIGEAELNYPVDLVFDEIDLAYTANNEEELWEAFEYCEEDDEHCDDIFDLEDWCFELILPVSFEMPDGSELQVGPDQEILYAIENWYEESDQEWDELPGLIFPVSVLFEDGSEQELSDEESFEEAIEDCE